MRLHFKSPGPRAGVYAICRRGEELRHLSFTIVQLDQSFPEYQFNTGDEEISLDFYTGAATVVAAGETFHVPERRSIGEGHVMLWVPPSAGVKVSAAGAPVRFTIGGAKSTASGPPVLEKGVARLVGKDTFTRRVFTHIAGNVAAQRLICGETVNQPGGWSSCPPHKHDTFRELPGGQLEVPMEEIYYFQTEPPQGFGFMRVYSDPADANQFDYAFAVEHGDTVLIPRGYHPVAACPGYTLNYTWILAGEGRAYGAWTDDPRHSWIKD